jgi:hypothetical protein
MGTYTGIVLFRSIPEPSVNRYRKNKMLKLKNDNGMKLEPHILFVVD